MVRFTGHPLVDVGVAVITLFSQRQRPEDVTDADLERMADYMATQYVRQPLKSFLTVAFTSNAWFSQDAFNPEKPGLTEEEREKRKRARDQWLDHHLRFWKIEDTSLEADVFTQEPAVPVSLSGKLQPGRAARAQIPLTLGDEYINFFAEGDPGIPISGRTLLCLQAFPLGCAKSGGRLLAVHSDNDEVILHFAGQFLQQNRLAIQLAQQAGATKLPEAARALRTLLVETLLDAAVLQRAARQDVRPFSITAYHLTNSGQGAALDLYHLPLQIVGFLHDMYLADYHQDWTAVVQRAWELPAPPKSGKAAAAPPAEFKPRRNWLYEDLFRLPGDAPRFIRTYFLRVALRAVRNVPTDPRGAYSVKEQAELVSWRITECFLRRILQMDKQRIAEIRQLGDRLAAYISGQNDRRFFRDFFALQNYGHLRNALIKANMAHVRRGQPPLITLDPYLVVFEEGDEIAHADWRLARDLVLIRMIEQLHGQGWLRQNADAIPEVVETAENAENRQTATSEED